MNKDLVSIIVPVYNVEKYLPRCLETIAQQTYKNIEVILVDDGSTDESGRICDDFCARETRAKVVHQANQGLGPARNTGLQMATGTYLVYVDGDDYLHHQAISVLHEAIVQDDSFDLAIGLYVRRNVGEDEKSCTDMQEAVSTPATTVLGADDLMKTTLTAKDLRFRTAWGKLYKTEFIGNTRFKNNQPVEDIDFNIRIYPSAKKAILVQATLYCYVLRPDSITKQEVDQRRWVTSGQALDMRVYREYCEQASEVQKAYSHLILQKLFRQAVFVKGKAFERDGYATICKDAEDTVRATRKAYWLNWKINPIEKLGVTLLLCSPRLTQWLLKKTKNW